MIVVSDTGPLNYLALIDAIDLLPQLYVQVIVPTAVYREMTHRNSPEVTRQWETQRPEWLDVQEATALPLGLDAGEQEAISLALHLSAELILSR